MVMKTGTTILKIFSVVFFSYVFMLDLSWFKKFSFDVKAFKMYAKIGVSCKLLFVLGMLYTFFQIIFLNLIFLHYLSPILNNSLSRSLRKRLKKSLKSYQELLFEFWVLWFWWALLQVY